MTIEDQLSVIIKSKYRSIKAFADANDLSTSTIHSILQHSIKNANVTTILKIFKALNLDIESIQAGTLSFNSESKIHNLSEFETAIINAYNKSPYKAAINKLLDLDEPSPEA